LTFANTKTPATLAAGKGVALDATEGEAAAWLDATDEGLDVVVPELPQAASARAAATNSASVAAQMDFLKRERVMAPIPPIV
jgi:hypothetical protein